MQVAFYLAGEITQVKESIPWVRCASGNVFFADGRADEGFLRGPCVPKKIIGFEYGRLSLVS